MWKLAFACLLVGCATAATERVKPEESKEGVGSRAAASVVLRIQQRTTKTTGTKNTTELCTYRLRLTPSAGGILVQQEGLFDRPIPGFAADETRAMFNARYAHFNCAIPDLEVDRDGTVVATRGTRALSDEISRAVRGYYEAHVSEFEPGLGDKVAMLFSVPMLDERAASLWRALFEIQSWPGAGVEGATTTEVPCPAGLTGGCRAYAYREVLEGDAFRAQLEQAGQRKLKRARRETTLRLVARNGQPLAAHQTVAVTIVTDAKELTQTAEQVLEIQEVDADAQSSTALFPNANGLQSESPNIVQHAIDRVSPQVASCLSAARAKGKSGTVALRLTFSGSGEPRGVDVYKNSVGPELVQCLTGALLATRAQGLAESGDVTTNLSFWVR